jgi:hypothetical protein
MGRDLWLVGLIALALGAPADAESGVIRIFMSAETTLLADQVRTRLIVGNEGDSPALDVRPYFLVGGSKLPLKGKRRLDPGERYDVQKLIPRESVAAGGYYIRAYVGYSESVGQRVTSMLLARVEDPSGGGTEGLRLSLSPRRLSAGTSGASARLRILNAGPQPRDLRVEALLAPSCKRPEIVPEGTAHLPAEGELLLTLRFPPSACEHAGEYPLYILAAPIGEKKGKPAVATASLLAAAPSSLLQRIFADKAAVLWAVWGLLFLLIAAVAMGIRRGESE